MKIPLHSISAVLLIGNSNAFISMTCPISYARYSIFMIVIIAGILNLIKVLYKRSNQIRQPCKTRSVYVRQHDYNIRSILLVKKDKTTVRFLFYLILST